MFVLLIEFFLVDKPTLHSTHIIERINFNQKDKNTNSFEEVVRSDETCEPKKNVAFIILNEQASLPVINILNT